MAISSTIRVAVAAALVVACAAAVPAEAAKRKPKPKPKRKPGPNLLVNPGFELSALEGNAAAPHGSLAQPVLPTGWAFEGLTVLFDHSPNVKRSGLRSAAISGSLSTPRAVCANGACHDNPANAVRDAAASTYSVTPAWRTLNPVPVKPNVRYTLSGYLGWDLMTQGTEATTKVRWLDANGSVIGQQVVGRMPSTARNSALLRWTLVTGVVQAPAKAASAHILLSHGDDAFIGQVRYDDVYFGTAP